MPLESLYTRSEDVDIIMGLSAVVSIIHERHVQDIQGCRRMGDSSELDKVTTAIRDALPELRKNYGVESLSVFGSIAHDDAGPGSDVDLLVRFEGEPPGLFEFLRLERRLSDIVDRPVDLVMESALKPRLRERILSEAVTT